MKTESKTREQLIDDITLLEKENDKLQCEVEQLQDDLGICQNEIDNLELSFESEEDISQRAFCAGFNCDKNTEQMKAWLNYRMEMML